MWVPGQPWWGFIQNWEEPRDFPQSPLGCVSGISSHLQVI